MFMTLTSDKIWDNLLVNKKNLKIKEDQNLLIMKKYIMEILNLNC
jgi:hypothetical protein